MKKSFYVALTLATLGTCWLSADSIVLKNGDILSGTVMEETDTSIVLESPMFGSLTLPKENVESITRDSEEPAEQAEDQVAEEAPEAGTAERFWDDLTDMIFPEGFSGEILLAYDYTESTDVQNGIKLGLTGEYAIEKHSFEGDIFYAYTRKKDADGNVSKPVDRYGFNLAYEYDVKDPFFLRGSNAFVIDQVKKFDPQNDTNLLGGWRAIDEEKMSLDLAIGPGLRYRKTPSDSGEWSPLITFTQDAFYQYSDFVRFDEMFSYSVDPEDTGNYSILFEISASVRLTDFAEPKIIYRNSYDSTVGSGGAKREQSLLLALTVPL